MLCLSLEGGKLQPTPTQTTRKQTHFRPRRHHVHVLQTTTLEFPCPFGVRYTHRWHGGYRLSSVSARACAVTHVITTQRNFFLLDLPYYMRLSRSCEQNRKQDTSVGAPPPSYRTSLSNSSSAYSPVRNVHRHETESAKRQVRAPYALPSFSAANTRRSHTRLE